MHENRDKKHNANQNSSPNQPSAPKQEEKKAEPFWDLIFSYTRKQALADGEQIDVSPIAKEAGLILPVFITRAVYENFVRVPDGVEAQDESGRLWDVLHMLRMAIARNRPDGSVLNFQLYVRNDNQRARLVTLRSECAAMDIDDPRPTITIMLPDER